MTGVVSGAEPLPPLEFSRPWDLRRVNDQPVTIEADETERAALARRFGLIGIDSLQATLALTQRGDTVHAHGRLTAALVQSCAVSGEDLATGIDEPLALRFVPDRQIADEELELSADDLDEIAYQGTVLDLGEAVAQSLGLAIDPYATGPDADRIRREAGLLDETTSGPFAALAALKKS